MRKSRILTFLFALWPGAGQMYLGYMKRGVSLMGRFLPTDCHYRIFKSGHFVLPAAGHLVLCLF